MPASPRRRAFGQHFLKDEKIISQIIDLTFAEVARTEARTLIEVGPGTGALTHPLLEGRRKMRSLDRFFIVEKDRKLADSWLERSRDQEGVKVLSQDFLEVPLESLLLASPTVVVSNLPYSSGTAITTRLCAEPTKIRSMILMFQAEVAHRLRAQAGEKAWGSLSIWVQNLWDVTRVVAVPPGAFLPPPDVNSEVVLMRPRSEPRIPGSAEDPLLLEKLLKTAFAHRRKMLRSGLPRDSRWLEALLKTSIDPTRRAESLTWLEWAEWFSALQGL